MAESNRLSSTTGGNREIDKLYLTPKVSNITRKTTLVDMFSKINLKSGKTENIERKIAFISL